MSIRQWQRPGIVMIACTTFVQAVWLVLLIGGDEPLHTAPLSALSGFNQPMSALLLLGTVVAASVVLFARRLYRSTRLFLLCPQLWIILLTAFRSVELIRVQHYADGVIRPWRFIAADQAPIISLALFYCVSLILVCTDHPDNYVES